VLRSRSDLAANRVLALRERSIGGFGSETRFQLPPFITCERMVLIGWIASIKPMATTVLPTVSRSGRLSVGRQCHNRQEISATVSEPADARSTNAKSDPSSSSASTRALKLGRSKKLLYPMRSEASPRSALGASLIRLRPGLNFQAAACSCARR